MKNKLVWLHLSDIHFLPRNSWRDSASRSDLITHLESVFAENDEMRPDLIFCTGDIAFGELRNSPLADQYGMAKNFFSELLDVCGRDGVPLSKERLFVVPGNHDIDRATVNFDAQSTMNAWAASASEHINKINQRFDEKSKEFVDAIKRLSAYEDFVRDFLPHMHDEAGRIFYAKSLEVNGLTVGVSGFNSAWTCSGEDDDRNIWLAGEWQFNQARSVVSSADVRVGLIHHPSDWFNLADRDVSNRRISSDYDFWLHGHSHNAWLTPSPSHVLIAAGAVGAVDSDEFGANLTALDFTSGKGVSHIYSKRAGGCGWTIAPIANHAPKGEWSFDLPSSVRKRCADMIEKPTLNAPENTAITARSATEGFIERILSKRLGDALKSFSSQPKVWVNPIISTHPETDKDIEGERKVDWKFLIDQPTSSSICAPPQYGLTCLAHVLVKEAWSAKKELWLYLDCQTTKPYTSAIDDAIQQDLQLLGLSETNIKCIVLDSWSAHEKDSLKLLVNLRKRLPGLPVICMQTLDTSHFGATNNPRGAEFENIYYLWSLPREAMRHIVAAYNEERQIGEEDLVINRLVSDLDVLNLHRTPLNCLTLLKVSEVDFDENPVNRSEMIKRVLFLLFNVDKIPTYKNRPDLKDCEYVIGYFCEQLIRSGDFAFSRERFLLEVKRCCEERLIDLETHVVFDVLMLNNIIVRRGLLYAFKFSYWVLYFAAQRMHHNQDFADYIFADGRYSNYPEIIEFYTGVDRRREDALKVLANDLLECVKVVQDKCGLPLGINPYKYAKWVVSPEMQEKMHREIAEGVKESNLPAEIKDRYLDEAYDRSRPYNQDIANFLSEHSFRRMMQTMRAGARALRNSDYADPQVKRMLLKSILACWEQATRVLFVVMPALANEGRAVYDGTAFGLSGDFGKTFQERMVRILMAIPANIVFWSEGDIFSQKMGPLLIDQLGDPSVGDVCRHEMILLLIRQRPRGWVRGVQAYVASVAPNSFYLNDVYRTLQDQYRYAFATSSALKDIEGLIKVSATKHLTGDKYPGVKTIAKVKFKEGVVPRREV